MSCGLVCCGARTIAVGDEFTTQALDYVKTSARSALLGQIFIAILCAIAVLNFSVMGMALEFRIASLSTMAAGVAVTHSMLAGAIIASQKPRVGVAATILPITAIGGIAEGIVYSQTPSWQQVDTLQQFTGIQTIGGALFTVTAFWLAIISAGIGWGLNRQPDRLLVEQELGEANPLIH